MWQFSEKGWGQLLVENMKRGDKTEFFWVEHFLDVFSDDKIGQVKFKNKMNFTSLFLNQKYNSNLFDLITFLQSIDNLYQSIGIFLFDHF